MATLLYLDPTFMIIALAIQKLLGWQRTLADTLFINSMLKGIYYYSRGYYYRGNAESRERPIGSILLMLPAGHRQSNWGWSWFYRIGLIITIS